MTVPTTNIGMSHIQTEFGGANPISMSEYYAGGSYVPSGQTNNAATPVPASGTISINNFKGATKVTFAASLPASINGSDFAISTTDATVTLAVNAAGGWTMTNGGSGTWKTGSGTGSDYDVRLTQTSATGLSIGGSLATWLNLASNRTWILSETRNGYYTSTFTGTLEIRMAASPFTVLDSASISMEAVVEV